ncbi:recombinase family protein [Ochrobactrum sp. AP1BH01-1]|uniref:recombinase family protein n=2 Tax=unclassified Ochrobactrum TaxID=239106 RepID=UPI00336A32BB
MVDGWDLNMSIRRAALYARFSTELQSDRSVDDQIALCRNFAERGGFEVVRTYDDRAKSGASMIERDGLLRLLADAKSNQFDVVIVEALDRVSRDQEDMAAIYKRLKFLGIDIIAVHDGKADTIQIGIRGLIGAIYLEDLKHKVRRGMSGRVRDGLSAGGKAYGYKPVLGKPGELVIDEDEAAVVRRIFREYALGRTPRQIAIDLNRDGIVPPRGAVWNASTLNGSKARQNGMLRNPIYYGVLIWNRVTMVRDPETGKRVSRNNPESEWQRKDVPALRIVDEETAAKVQARIEERTFNMSPERAPKRPRMLSGILKCGKCGGGMTLDGYNRGRMRVRCVRTRETGACDHKRKYHLEDIEAGTVEMLRQQFSKPELLQAYLDAFLQDRRQKAAEINNTRSILEKRLARLESELERAIDLCIKGVLSEDKLMERKKEIDPEIVRIKADLSMQPPPPKIDVHPATIAALRGDMEELGRILTKGPVEITEAVVQTLRSVVDSVVVYPTEPRTAPVVQVRGKLARLLGEDIENGFLPKAANKMVAEEGFEPPTQGL